MPPSLLGHLAREFGAQVAQARLERYRHDPALFVSECIAWKPGEGPTPYQAEILSALPQHRRVSVRGPHALGKTALAAWLILWFAITRDGRDWKIATTASSWQQLVQFLWPEIHLWAARLRPEVIGRGALRDGIELLDRSLKLRTGQAFAMASDNPAKMEGAHADHILVVFDEAKTIPAATFDALEGAMASGECYALAISTPGEPQGRFYEIQRRAPGTENWWVRHVTCDETIAAGRMNPHYPAECEALWHGTESSAYQNRVLGEFASSDEEGVIPLAWVEAAMERWEQWKDSGTLLSLTCVGVDVAREGTDKTVLALRSGNVVTSLVYCQAKQDTTATARQVASVLARYGGYAMVDVVGMGAGVVDPLRHMRKPDGSSYKVEAFNAGAGTKLMDLTGEFGFVNCRSACWWLMRELLDPANGHDIALPKDDLLIGDLTAPHWRVGLGGRLMVETKDEIRKRLGRSTDSGDAVVMSFWKERVGKAGPVTASLNFEARMVGGRVEVFDLEDEHDADVEAGRPRRHGPFYDPNRDGGGSDENPFIF
jgi:hypothetical protein